MAQKNNEGTQAYKFWNTEKWKKTYQYQVILANRLISKHSEGALSRAINSNELSRAYSLRHPKVGDVVRRHDVALKSESLKEEKIIEVTEDAKTRTKGYGKKSKFNQLRNLDGKENDN
tara:strand:+ start:213 stop:566 length:354 start_codon:yes stop_codon:yes gene_type:complete